MSSSAIRTVYYDKTTDSMILLLGDIKCSLWPKDISMCSLQSRRKWVKLRCAYLTGIFDVHACAVILVIDTMQFVCVCVCVCTCVRVRMQRCSCNFKWVISNSSVQLPSGERHKTSPMVIQHWFGYGFSGAVRQQAITWTNIDRVLWRHMASLGRNGLMWAISQLFLNNKNTKMA